MCVLDGLCVCVVHGEIHFFWPENKQEALFLHPPFSIRWAEEARHLSWGWNTRPSAWDWSQGSMKRVSLQRLPVTGCQTLRNVFVGAGWWQKPLSIGYGSLSRRRRASLCVESWISYVQKD